MRQTTVAISAKAIDSTNTLPYCPRVEMFEREKRPFASVNAK